MDEQLELVKIVSRRLDDVGIPYMLTGSVAMALYVNPRMTRDVDVVIDLTPGDVKIFAQQFASGFYLDDDAVDDAVSRKAMFNIIHDEWIVKVDFIVRKSDPYHEMEFNRRRRVTIDGLQVSIVTPEDLILSKLLWAKESGSVMQHDDVTHLTNAIKGLDWHYMERWAGALDVGDVLRNLRPK